MSLLGQAAIFLAAAVLAVPVSRWLRLGAVLGYLAAGIVIGPFVLGLIRQVDGILHFAELGVVLLLFIIGLELQPSRLWVLRKAVFGLGGAQVAATTALVAGIAMLLGQNWQAALVIGAALAMSSTAFVLQILAERKQLTTRFGRSAFAILLFQDLAVIPLLALIPLLGAPDPNASARPAWAAALIAVGVIAAVVTLGRLLLRPVLQIVARTRMPEIFTAATLLVVIGVSLLMSAAGLSMSLGAFLAGVLLADSEFRHELEANIEPFKGLLLGLFFISVGMSVDLTLVASAPVQIMLAVAGLMAAKALVLFGVGRLSRHDMDASRSLAAALSQGGEFAFVLFNIAAGKAILDARTADFLVVVVSLSMAATPLVMALNDRLCARRRVAQRPFDDIDGDGNPVVIAGFGRVGQIIGRLLRMKGIRFTALDISADQVDTVRRFGNTVYFGDASRLDLLTAARVQDAKVLVLAIDDVEASLRTAETVRRHFPRTRVVARARNRFHAYRLMDLGVELIERETLLSSLEMGRQVLTALGLAEDTVRASVERFREHDLQTLRRQHAVYHDESQLIQTSKEAAAELEGLFETDPAQDGAPAR